MKSSRSALGWVTLGNRVLTVAAQLFIGTLLQPAQFGEFAVAMSMVILISAFQAGDLPRVALQDGGQEREALASIQTWLIAGTVLTAALCWLWFLYGQQNANPVVVLPLIGLTFIRVLTNGRVTLLSAAGKIPSIAVLTATEGTIRNVVLILAAVSQPAVWNLVLAEGAAILCTYVVSCRVDTGVLSWRWRIPRERLKQVGMVAAIAALTSMEREFSTYAVGVWSGVADAGQFAFANRIAAQLPIIMLPMIVLEALPRLMKSGSSQPAFELAVSDEIRRIGRFAVPIALVLGIAAPLIVGFVWDSKWLTAAYVVPVLVLTACLRLGFTFQRASVEALGHIRLVARLSVLDVAISVPALMVGGLLFGLPGVVSAQLAATTVSLLVSVAASRGCRGSLPEH